MNFKYKGTFYNREASGIDHHVDISANNTRYIKEKAKDYFGKYDSLRIDHLDTEDHSRLKPRDFELYRIKNNRLYYIDLMK